MSARPSRAASAIGGISETDVDLVGETPAFRRAKMTELEIIFCGCANDHVRADSVSSPTDSSTVSLTDMLGLQP
ncbi:unnamed protein product [Periconia digitata]|uniref:Uncharacterized protein n=1 Tax=Periconia digitata TaxID=1303443 RepID=A0A9W4XGW8_9PLEO|nr:unnamed protein product [Periconia digitata]